MLRRSPTMDNRRPTPWRMYLPHDEVLGFMFLYASVAARDAKIMTERAQPQATILITTKNRKDELLGAVRSALLQTAAVEVLVVDDGSTDGTAQMMAENFPPATHPNVKFHRFEESGGYIGRRNQGAQLAAAPYVFSIDDDAAFSTPNIVEQTLADFDHPRIGAVAIPYINVNQDK